jgi:hypothetical protein
MSEVAGAFTIAFALVCNRLIERGSLDREAVKADLAAEVERLRESDPSAVKEMILSGLAFALHAPRPQDEFRPTASTPPPSENSDAAHLLEIDDAVERLKLIGSEG